MNKSAAIKRIMGPLLFPLGFTYKTQSQLWIFTREITNNAGEAIHQEIYVQKSNFANSLFLRMRTNAYGRAGDWGPASYVPGCKAYLFPYANDEDFIQLIEKFTRVIKIYGLAKLEEISEPTVVDRPSVEDQTYLFKNHVLLTQQFVERKNISVQVDPDTMVETIYIAVRPLKGQTYSEVKDEILILAAFYGTWLAEYYHSEWEFDETMKSAEVSMGYKNGILQGDIFPLGRIFVCLQRVSEYPEGPELVLLFKQILLPGQPIR